MNEYELMAVLHPRLTADETDGAIEFLQGQITSRGGEIIEVDNWGRRRLAYPVDANFEGTYILTTLRMPPEATQPMEAQLRLSEDVIRHLLIRGIIPYEGEDPRQAQVRPGSTAPAETPPPEPAATAEAADAPAAPADAPAADAPAAAAETAAEDASSEAPAEASTETAAEASSEAPAEAPAEAPSDDGAASDEEQPETEQPAE